MPTLWLQSRWQPRLLIVGAGEIGEVVLRTILRARPATYQAIGFLDPDPSTRNRTVHSVRVLGSIDDLGSVVGQRDIDLVILALAPVYAELTEGLLDRCKSLGVPALAAATFVQMHFAGLPVLPAAVLPSDWADRDGTPTG